MGRITNIVLFLSLLFLTLYIPFTITAYSLNWYKVNFESQDTYSMLGYEKSVGASSNLIAYFLFQDKLDSTYFNEKEIMHMKDVRNIYIITFILGILSAVFFINLYEREKIMKYTKINSIIIAILALALVNFFYFWVKIHEIIFSNFNWVYDKTDITYYLFPLDFFIMSFSFIVIIGFILNTLIYFLAKYKEY